MTDEAMTSSPRPRRRDIYAIYYYINNFTIIYASVYATNDVRKTRWRYNIQSISRTFCCTPAVDVFSTIENALMMMTSTTHEPERKLNEMRENRSGNAVPRGNLLTLFAVHTRLHRDLYLSDRCAAFMCNNFVTCVTFERSCNMAVYMLFMIYVRHNNSARERKAFLFIYLLPFFHFLCVDLIL